MWSATGRAPVAHRTERSAPDRKAAGSIPARRTLFRLYLDDRASAVRRGEDMKAAVCTGYGPPEVLQIRTMPDPRPRKNEVCIRQVATSVTASDCIVRGLKLRGVYRLFMRAAFGFRAPRKGIIGMIAAGEIESVGREVTSFKPGDQVF